MVKISTGGTHKRTRLASVRLGAKHFRKYTPSATNCRLWIPKSPKSQEQHTTLVGRELTQAPVTREVRVLRVESGAGYLRLSVLRVGTAPGTLQVGLSRANSGANELEGSLVANRV